MYFISVLLGSWRPPIARLPRGGGGSRRSSGFTAGSEPSSRNRHDVMSKTRLLVRRRGMTPQTHDDRSRWLALYVLCAGMLMIVLDVTIVNVALPSIQDSLGFSQGDLAWTVNAYLIAFGGLLLLAGRVGDLVGHRRVFLIGLGVFTAASLLCGLAEARWML